MAAVKNPEAERKPTTSKLTLYSTMDPAALLNTAEKNREYDRTFEFRFFKSK